MELTFETGWWAQVVSSESAPQPLLVCPLCQLSLCVDCPQQLLTMSRHILPVSVLPGEVNGLHQFSSSPLAVWQTSPGQREPGDITPTRSHLAVTEDGRQNLRRMNLGEYVCLFSVDGAIYSRTDPL